MAHITREIAIQAFDLFFLSGFMLCCWVVGILYIMDISPFSDMQSLNVSFILFLCVFVLALVHDNETGMFKTVAGFSLLILTFAPILLGYDGDNILNLPHYLLFYSCEFLT